MLVILSDLHLTDGSCAASVSEEFFQGLRQRLQELAWHASWRADGSYRPLETIDLVLLGDTLDLLHSTRWFDEQVVPWKEAESPQASGTVERIAQDVLRENAAGLEIFRALAAGHAIGLPAAARRGRADLASPQQPVTVRLHYLVGEHDWWLHVERPEFLRLRRMVAEHLGLATPAEAPFPHDPLESAEVLDVLRRHRVMARHGDVFDPLSYSGTRDRASLADVVAIDLLGRFRREVADPLRDELAPTLTACLDEIAHVRPLEIVPVLLEAAVARSDTPPAVKRFVRRAWNDAVERFVDCDALPDLLPGRSAAWRDRLARTLAWTTSPADRFAFPAGSSANGSDGATGLPGQGSLAGQALLEEDFRNRRAKHIVYGHTHRWETSALDASSADGFVLRQMYFNAGTWRRSYQLTEWSRRVREYVAVEQLNVLAFFRGDERSGRTFEVCSHTLAPRPPHTVQRRLDLPGSANQASGANGQTAGGNDGARPPIPGPHFRAQAARAT